MRVPLLVALLLAIGLLGAGGSLENPEGAFHHKKHASLKLKCAFCHATADKEEQAGFPAVSQCKICHTRLAEREIPSQRIYRLADFVFFSHAKHVTAKVECSACHGEVAQQDAMKVERSMKMAACVSCHKENKATVVCTACHELGQ